MPWNGSGTFNLDPSYSPEVAGTTIQPGRYNGLTGDIASGITNALAKDGQNTPTANLPMGAKKLTGLAAGSAAGESVRYEQANVIGETSITANATTADIFAAPTARVLFNGTGVTVTAFPSSSLDTWKIVRFNGINTLTHSAGLVIIGGLNITTASGDTALIYSSGSNAYVASYYAVAGATTAISGLTSAGAANTITGNADFAQSWQWKLTTASKIAFSISESLASTGAGSTLLAAVNLSGSTARPFVAQWTGTVNGQIGYSTAADAQLTAPTLSGTAAGPDAIVAAGGAGTTTGTGGDVTITAGAGGSTSGVGGDVIITGGSAASGSTGGDVVIKPGPSAGTTDGIVEIYAGNSNEAALRVTRTGHFVLPTPTSSANQPTIISGGGTGATISGSDSAFRIVLGTSPGTTAILVDFNASFSTTPVAVVHYHCQDTDDDRVYITSLTANGLTLEIAGGSWTAGYGISVIVVGIDAA